MLLEFNRPDRCLVGTVGRPGNRLFLIQVAQGSALAAVAVEKQQAQMLGVRIGEVLDQLAELGHDVPERRPPADMGPLDAPVEVAFRAAAIGLAWDHERKRLLIELIAGQDETPRREPAAGPAHPGHGARVLLACRTRRRVGSAAVPRVRTAAGRVQPHLPPRERVPRPTVPMRLTVVGRLVDASNGTFLAEDEAGARWVYKPVAGEAPLWDFPEATLGRREVAAHALSDALGLGVVPLTQWVDGPLGEGSAQLWVDGGPTDLVDLLPPTDITEAWLPIVAGRPRPGRRSYWPTATTPACALWRSSTPCSTTPTARVDISSLTGIGWSASTTASPCTRTRNSAPSCGAGRGTP